MRGILKFTLTMLAVFLLLMIAIPLITALQWQDNGITLICLLLLIIFTVMFIQRRFRVKPKEKE